MGMTAQIIIVCGLMTVIPVCQINGGIADERADVSMATQFNLRKVTGFSQRDRMKNRLM
jgi:hypothetical protein